MYDVYVKEVGGAIFVNSGFLSSGPKPKAAIGRVLPSWSKVVQKRTADGKEFNSHPMKVAQGLV